MKILDILNSPWAISPSKLSEIRSIYSAHLRGEKIDWKGMEARVGLMISEPDEPYQIMNGVAVIPIHGVLSKGASFFSFLFGRASMKQIGMAFAAALDDQAVNAILLDVDSPGGTVDGTEELAEQIFQARGIKPIVAYTDGTMASAAYWIASAADKIFISGDTVEVGSIGVVATHIDYSEQDKQYGEKWTEITGGHYKRLASGHKPLSDDGASYIQGQVDYLYAAFVNTIARNRGVDEKRSLAMADGKIFIGTQAIEAGLVDGVSTFSDLVDQAAGVAAINTGKYIQEGNIVNLEELKQKHPELYDEALAAGKSMADAEAEARGRAAGLDEGKSQGAAAERQRIIDVRAQLIPGHEAIIEEMANDGKTTGPEAAVRVLAAEKAKREAAHDAFFNDGKLGVQSPAAPTDPPPSGMTAKNQAEAGEQLDRMAKEIKAAKNCSYSDALNAALAANPALAKIYSGQEG